MRRTRIDTLMRVYYRTIEGARRLELPTRDRIGLPACVEVRPDDRQVPTLRHALVTLRDGDLDTIELGWEGAAETVEMCYQEINWSNVVVRGDKLTLRFHPQHIDAVIGFLENYEAEGSAAPNYVEVGFIYPLSENEALELSADGTVEWSTYLAVYVEKAAPLPVGNILDLIDPEHSA